MGRCYDPETKQQSYLWKSSTSEEIETIQAEHQKPVDDVLTEVTVHLEFILRGQTVNQHYCLGGLAFYEVGSPPKTSGTMAVPELIHST